MSGKTLAQDFLGRSVVRNCPIAFVPGRELYSPDMSAVVASPKRRKFSRASLQAGDRLLKAVKAKMLRENGKINYSALRRQGYSEATIARLKAI